MKIAEINQLGKELELYTTLDYIGKGFPIVLPRGARIIKLIRNYVENIEEQNGYKIVRTPSISNSEIYKIEDRYELEKKELFVIKNDENESNEIVLKPYVQPFHCSIYKSNHHSYKELPIKYCETSTVFRNERDIKGMIKTRQITLSDSSIFCTPEKLEREIKDAIELQRKIIKKIGLDIEYCIETWNDTKKEEYIGNISEWENATNAMKSVLNDLKIEYKVEKNARMYGPAIKVLYKEMDFSSLQIDFEISHRFDLHYTDKDNVSKFPIYMHNTLIGSYEGLLGILIEKYEGNFPLWFNPVQILIVTDSEEFDDYAKKIKVVLESIQHDAIRVEIDNSSISKQNKLDKAKKLRIPYILTIGKKELNNETITVNEEKIYKLNEFIEEVEKWQTQF